MFMISLEPSFVGLKTYIFNNKNMDVLKNPFFR